MEKSDKERIEKEAEEYVKRQGTHDRPDITRHDYLAGATAEHERAQQELQAYRDIIKELLPLAEEDVYLLTDRSNGSRSKQITAEKYQSIISRARKLIDTVTPTP